MSEQLFIKPAPGRIIRHPEKLNHIISAAGEWVTRATQWDRYLRTGDVLLAEPDKKQTGQPHVGDK
jgi:hypothetical protein